MEQSKKSVIVLGAGLVGGPMAMDLARDGKFNVTTVDISEENLKRLSAVPGITALKKDLKNDSIADIVAPFDLVVNATPGFMGYATLKKVIEAGKNVVDIAFYIEDAATLDELAKEKGVSVVVDIGVAPGMANVLIGHGTKLLDETTDVTFYVGGLPEVREWPFEYKAVFSPIDVIEEYTRPARLIQNGKTVVREALSDPELLSFPKIGTLEAFNTDGLRSMTRTINCPNIKEKTLRYPGHIDKMRVLRETGFFSYDPVELNGQKIRPIDVTAKLLFPKWKLNEGEVDITVMQVNVEGLKGGKKVRHTWDLYDKYDPETKVHSMARTTGYTATTVVRMMSEGLFNEKGVTFPETLGLESKNVDYLLNGLKERKVIYTHKVTEL